MNSDNETDTQLDPVDNTDSDPDFDINDAVNTTPTKTRKRKRNMDKWIQNIRKRNRNSGKEYTSKKGIIIPARQTTNCVCNNKCSTKFSEEVKVLKNPF